MQRVFNEHSTTNGLTRKSCNLARGCHATTNSSKDNLCGRRVPYSSNVMPTAASTIQAAAVLHPT
jgi:hypothetical protein